MRGEAQFCGVAAGFHGQEVHLQCTALRIERLHAGVEVVGMRTAHADGNGLAEVMTFNLDRVGCGHFVGRGFYGDLRHGRADGSQIGLAVGDIVDVVHRAVFASAGSGKAESHEEDIIDIGLRQVHMELAPFPVFIGNLGHIHFNQRFEITFAIAFNIVAFDAVHGILFGQQVSHHAESEDFRCHGAVQGRSHQPHFIVFGRGGGREVGGRLG